MEIIISYFYYFSNGGRSIIDIDLKYGFFFSVTGQVLFWEILFIDRKLKNSLHSSRSHDFLTVFLCKRIRSSLFYAARRNIAQKSQYSWKKFDLSLLLFRFPGISHWACAASVFVLSYRQKFSETWMRSRKYTAISSHYALPFFLRFAVNT